MFVVSGHGFPPPSWELCPLLRPPSSPLCRWTRGTAPAQRPSDPGRLAVLWGGGGLQDRVGAPTTLILMPPAPVGPCRLSLNMPLEGGAEQWGPQHISLLHRVVLPVAQQLPVSAHLSSPGLGLVSP